MVVCNMDSLVIPTPPALPPPLKGGSIRSRKTSSSRGFRLQDHPQPHQQDDTGSVYSVCKQKIDSMFESELSAKAQNCVQARIEKMFSDVAMDNGIPINDIGCHVFSVDYLGSVPLHDRVTSLAGLQDPLKELYFAYKRNGKHKKSLTGRLEISGTGLKVQYQGEKGDLEQLNPFPTIAVWSAVKFVMQGTPQLSYAFLPLITDPDNLDKQQFFRNIDAGDKKLISSEVHSPLFSVVMRKIGVHKQLECHGFICQTSEDAIVIAATLYKALMAHMKAKEKKPKNKNGVTCMSMTSSIYNEYSGSPPVRPPRRKRSASSSIKSGGETLESVGTSETQRFATDPQTDSQDTSSTPKKTPQTTETNSVDLDAILPYEEPKEVAKINEEIVEIKPQSLLEKFNTYRSNTQKQITAEIKQVMTESSNMGLKRVKSVRKRTEEGLNKDNSGDILTKVTIPRSGSFLNAGGLTRYKSKVQRTNGQATGGSPLGFSELFNEFRLQEGLHSIDEILGVIIDPEGMSFNDLKPIYKEFLLKLALTLTKDELYQRSKLIMRRHKKKLLRNNSVQPKKRPVPIYNKFKRLKHIFQKIKLAKENKHSDNNNNANENDRKIHESSLSTSSYDTRQFKPKEVKVQRKQSYKKRSSNRKRRERASTSEESDFFSLRRKKNHAGSNQNRNSSSGYVSCSECSYDSDTCTCTSADKCYCSLGNKICKYSPNSSEKQVKCCCVNGENFIWCGCDTDSCTDSNKCYCTIKREKNAIFEQLKQKGFIPNSENAISPRVHKKLCKKNSNTKSTKSLEYMSNPSEKYYEKLRQNSSTKQKKKRSYSSDNLAVDYELFSIANGKFCNISNGSLYAKPIVGDSDKRKNCQASLRSTSSQKYSQNRNITQSTSIPVKDCTEALSVKKSAEIAALFADIKLSQTTDIAHLIPKQIDAETLLSYKNAYNRRPSSRCSSRMDRIENKNSTTSSYFNKAVNNSSFAGKNSKSNMYSARNGLYTIQSQSDDSRSSLERTSRRKGEYRPQSEEKKSINSGLENTLGYLP